MRLEDVERLETRYNNMKEAFDQKSNEYERVYKTSHDEKKKLIATMNDY